MDVWPVDGEAGCSSWGCGSRCLCAARSSAAKLLGTAPRAKRKPRREMSLQRASSAVPSVGKETPRDLWRNCHANPIRWLATDSLVQILHAQPRSRSPRALHKWRTDERLISRNSSALAPSQSPTMHGWLSTWARWPSRKRHDAPRLRSALGPQRGLSTSVRAALGCEKFLLGLDGRVGLSQLLLRLREFPDLAL